MGFWSMPGTLKSGPPVLDMPAGSAWASGRATGLSAVTRRFVPGLFRPGRGARRRKRREQTSPRCRSPIYCQCHRSRSRPAKYASPAVICRLPVTQNRSGTSEATRSASFQGADDSAEPKPASDQIADPLVRHRRMSWSAAKARTIYLLQEGPHPGCRDQGRILTPSSGGGMRSVSWFAI